MKRTYITNFNLGSIDLALLVLRLGISLLMLTHGIPKLFTLFGGEEIQFLDPYGLGIEASLTLAVIAEFICSLLLILGLGTRLALIPLMITMITAVFVVHVNDNFTRQELPLLYLLAYIVLLITGPGKYALDYYWIKRRKKA
ncbi:MAG: DoxX family protein [Salinimicrobium sp.]